VRHRHCGLPCRSQAARPDLARAHADAFSGDGARRRLRARRARSTRRDSSCRVPGAPRMIPTPKSFALDLAKGVVTITLDRPKRLNALTFEVYQELAETFETLDRLDDVRAVVITGRGRGFCSGGDQDDIIKHLLGRDTPGLVSFTRATGRLIAAMRACKR